MQKILLRICPSVEAFIWPQNQPKSGQNPFEIGSSRTGWGVILVTVASYLFELYYVHDWQYHCAVGRLPIYVLGMYCWSRKVEVVKWTYSAPLTLIGGYLFLFHGNLYFAATLATPFAVSCLQLFINRFHRSMEKWLGQMGQHTLEIYIGNVVALALTGKILKTESIPVLMIKEITLTILFSILFIFINQAIKKYTRL